MRYIQILMLKGTESSLVLIPKLGELKPNFERLKGIDHKAETHSCLGTSDCYLIAFESKITEQRSMG